MISGKPYGATLVDLKKTQPSHVDVVLYFKTMITIMRTVKDVTVTTGRSKLTSENVAVK